MAFDMKDYVDVAERLREFYAKFPDGRITRKDHPEVVEVAGKPFVMYTALAYRDPEDKIPAVGTAWEPFPGPTPYTKDSELMNAETAAWGRAIVAAGIPSKKITSREEVEARKPAPRIDENGVKLLAETAKELVDAGKVDTKKLSLLLTSHGATDTSSVRKALSTLTPDQAVKLQETFAKAAA